MTTLRCPTCGRRFEPRPDSTCRPFCCERCRLIDLGAWISEKHRIAGDPVGEAAEFSEMGLANDAAGSGATH
jgi:hypothetical protein